jgi:HK97 family phage major capsid protein
MNNTLQLTQDRAAAIDAGQALFTKAELEKRALTTEEQTQFDALMTKVDGINGTLARSKKLAEMGGNSAPVGGRQAAQVHNNAEDKPWASFGEMLQAVQRAGNREAPYTDPRLHKRAASGLSEAVPADGGFLVQPDFSSELIKRAYDTGILAKMCRKLPLSNDTNSLKINGIDETSRANGSRWGGVQAYWANEADALTGKKPKFRQMLLTLKKLTGLCYATDELLKDTSALGEVIMQGFSEEFGFKVDDAIINGDGSDKPSGILNSAALVSVAKETGQAAATLVPQNIAKMRMRLWARSRQNAVWLVNQDIAAELGLMKLPIGTGGVSVYLPANGLSGQPYDTLYGRPVIEIEQAQTLGTKGDIMLVDLSQYLLIDKQMESASSVHVRFLYDENTFRFIYRVDGQSAWHQPLTPFNGSNTQSPFISLDAR